VIGEAQLVAVEPPVEGGEDPNTVAFAIKIGDAGATVVMTLDLLDTGSKQSLGFDMFPHGPGG